MAVKRARKFSQCQKCGWGDMNIVYYGESGCWKIRPNIHLREHFHVVCKRCSAERMEEFRELQNA